ncbi:MAG TPA: glycosyltransferase family 2 protein [Ilumatobacteraceae bacterium]|nr:glycosyltransferase family 2 protein [Ilumatobacteraceae bacterium]
MTGERCTLSVVMPVYNEEAVIDEVLTEVRREVLDRVPDSELVVIDDCSTDQTALALERASASDARIRVLTNGVNAGHGVSVRRGFDAARGEWIFQIDSDGQVDLSQFPTLWQQRADGDLLIGVRAERHDPRHRLVLTAVTRVIVSTLARRWLRDANVPFKLVRSSLFRHLAPFIPSDAFAPSILIALGAARTGARVTEMEIRHLPRAHGQSTLRVWRLARACLRSGWQTIRFSARGLPRFQPTP